MSKMTIKWTLIGALALLLVPAAGALEGIVPGFDYWQTLGSGATRYNFANDPIPADFFCVGSQPFEGYINFEGLPLGTEPAGILGTTDTIIERLDFAKFDENGVATSRIQPRALNLRGVEQVETVCGNWSVSASLGGRQPISKITFTRQHELGGVFSSDLRLNVRINFTHTDTGESRHVMHQVYLPTINDTPWATATACRNTVEPRTTAFTIESVDLLDQPRDLDVLAETATRIDLGANLTATNKEAEPVDDDVVTGCMCNPETGECLPVYSWHDPCPSYPPPFDCEIHFVSDPCDLPMYEHLPMCQNPEVQDALLRQLQDLEDKGYITEAPEVALEKHTRFMRRDEKQQLRTRE